MNESFSAVVWAGLACSSLLALAARPLITFISGAQYAPAAPLLQILCLALAIMFVGNLFGFTLVALRQQRALLKLYSSLMIGNILLNLLFIPHFGAYAAAWTTVATEGAATLVAGLLVWRLIPFSVIPVAPYKFHSLIKKP